jgi:hypothetical protein
MATFERLLRRGGLRESDRRLYRWLLSFSAMTVGDWPDRVPPDLRVANAFTDRFYGAAAERTRRDDGDLDFVDRARELGVDNPGNGRGCAVEDLDGDGDLDLVTTGYFGGLSLFVNQDGHGFVDRTAGSGLEGLRQPLAVVPGDYDGDGDLDLFVTLPFSHYRLLENRGGGRFRDVTRRSGLLDAVPPGALAVSWMAAWGDVDRDGDLDLVVAGWNLRFPWVRGLAARRRIDTKLFVNDRGRFHDATAEWGLARLVADQHFIGASFGDYDADGWLDLFLSSPLPYTSVLLHNQPAAGRSTATAGRRLVPSDLYRDPAPGFTAAFVDADQDGRLDIFRGGAGDARSSVTQAVFGDRGGRYRSGHSTILLQGADGRFVPHDELFAGGALPISTMGASYGDLDNDGCLDFYLGTGSPEPWFVLPNLMFRGERRGARCTGRLRDVSALAGFGTVQKGHGIVFFDFDSDGDQDVYSSLGGMWPADRWTSQLFINRGVVGGWVKVRLHGRRSNRFGLGSTVTVRARRADGSELVRRRQVDHATGFGSAPYLLHVGLADAVAIDEIEVAWLGSGCVGGYPARLGALNRLDEADCLARPRSYRAPLGGTARTPTPRRSTAAAPASRRGRRASASAPRG